MPDRDDATVEIQIRPPEPEELALSEPGPDGGDVESPETVVSRRVEEDANLVDRQGLKLRPVGPRPVDQRADVARHVPAFIARPRAIRRME